MPSQMPTRLAVGLKLGSALSPAGWGIRPKKLGSPVSMNTIDFGDIVQLREYCTHVRKGRQEKSEKKCTPIYGLDHGCAGPRPPVTGRTAESPTGRSGRELCRDGLLLNGLLQGGQSVLTHQHHLALLVQREGQGPDVGVFAGELDDLRPDLTELGIALTWPSRGRGCSPGFSSAAKPSRSLRTSTSSLAIRASNSSIFWSLSSAMCGASRVWIRRALIRASSASCTHLPGVRGCGAGVLGHEAGQRGVHLLERLCGGAKGQAVSLEVGVLDRQVQQVFVDALELGKSLGELGQKVLLGLGAARLAEAPPTPRALAPPPRWRHGPDRRKSANPGRSWP